MSDQRVESTRREPETLQFDETLKFDRSSRLGEVLLDLLRSCRNELAIWTRDLEGPLLDDDFMLEEIKQIAITASRPDIRILLLDSTPAVQNDHRMLLLAQRLPSMIHIQRPAKDYRDYVPAFMVTDRQHSIFRELGDKPAGLLEPFNRIYARRLMDFFDRAWGQSDTDPELQRLFI